MGDSNAKVGVKRVGDVVEPSGIATVNERGSRLIEWCQINDFTLTNTWYQNLGRRQLTEEPRWSGWANDLSQMLLVEADGSVACSLGSSVWQGGGCRRGCGFKSYSDVL
ncbi:craniofacial development protein 2-like [Plakobranchus ocellatus]|uniref:Craniofacial development protein 2-like n=1 Tax=Plakobranchus ocellatus TaxID=259542 RepID=A0AAV3YNP7_9GAST|nr:craniofacial development protein 2-like [Plakobranchus ocellatus]